MRTYVYTPAPVEAIQWRTGDGTVLNLSGRVVEVADTDYLTRDEYGDVRVIPAAWFEVHYKEVDSDPAVDLGPINTVPDAPREGFPDAHPDAHPASATPPEAQSATAPTTGGFPFQNIPPAVQPTSQTTTEMQASTGGGSEHARQDPSHRV